MTPTKAVVRSRYCQGCRVDIGALNCPRCGHLTTFGPHVKVVRKSYPHDVYVATEYVLRQESHGHGDRHKVCIPKEES